MSSTSLDLSQIHDARTRIERTYEPGAFEPADAYRIAAPVTLAFHIDKDHRQYHLIGRVTATLEVTCGRCLEPFTLPVDEPFDLLYLPHTENAGEGEIAIEEDDLSTAYYRDEEIDLGHLAGEQFYLVLPMKPLCADECRGLCPQCGTNLNSGSCTCQPAWEDPRWAELRGLTGGKPGEK